MRRFPVAACLVVSWMLCGSEAQAHVSLNEGNGFTSGLLHPLLAPQHALLLTAFGLLCGQREGRLLASGLLSLLAGLFCAWLAQFVGQPKPDAHFVLIGVAFLCGSAAAATLAFSDVSAGLLGTVAGLALGLNFYSDEHPSLAETAGEGIGIVLLYLNVTALSYFARSDWQKIGVRIAGSWAAAASLMNMALLLRR